MENDVPQVYLLGKTYLSNNENFYIRNDSIIHMAAGDRHTIVITESGRAYAFGDNNSGQLGLGHTNNIEKVSCIKSLKFGETGENVILAACGRESSLIATNQGSLYAFGSNHHCQLGIESEELTTICSDPVKIEYFHSKMSWKQLSMGAEHTCVLTNDGQVYVWGSNEDGQCGLGGKYDIIQTPKELRLEYSVIAISCGYYHTALISEDGRLFLFGNNSDRQLGCSIKDQHIDPMEISFPDPIKAVACGNQHTIVLTKKGDVYTCGRGGRGQLGLGRRVSITKHFEMIENLPKYLTAIAAGEAHTAIVDSHGEIYMFGDGKYGKLNYESESNQFEPYFIDKFKGYNVLKVVCGGFQTIILAQKKSIKNKTSSKIKNIAHLNSIDSIDETSNNKNSFLYSESISNLDELSTSMKSILMNTTHVEINGKLQPTNFHLNNEDSELLKTGVLDRTVSFNKITNNLPKSNNYFSSIHDRRLNHINNLRIKQNSDNENSSSEERSISISEENNQKNSFNEINDFQTLSSTTSGRTSSSLSSNHNENETITSEANDELLNSFYSSATQTSGKPYIINSNIDSKKSQIGFFSKIFHGKSSEKLPKTITKKSRTCSIM